MKESELLEKIQAARDEVHPKLLQLRDCCDAGKQCITPVVKAKVKCLMNNN